MKRNVVIHLATVVFIGTAASSAHAHHSHGMFYDICTSVTIDGTIEAVQWKNPHILIDLKTSDGAVYRSVIRAKALDTLTMRWSRPLGQFGGRVKLGSGCRQAASLSIMPVP